MTDLNQLRSLSTAAKFLKNDIIIKEGTLDPYSMYIILSGGVDVYRNYGKYTQVFLVNLGAGSFFGETSLFLKKPRTATVVAATDTLVLEITEDNAHEIIKTNPGLLYGLIKTLCSRIESLNEKVTR